MEVYDIFIKSSDAEKIAFFCSILYVITAAQQKKYCWLFSIISTCIYIQLTFSVNLFFESILNVFYLLVAVKGLWDWNQSSNVSSSAIHFKTFIFHFKVISLGLLVVFILGFIAQKYSTQSLSYLDAFTTVFSFITTYMVIKKIIENWIYWIVIDSLSVYLYYAKNLKLTAVLFFIFTLLAFYGFYNWKRLMNQSKSLS
jgi:nicotinamide mononucleotide transporter